MVGQSTKTFPSPPSSRPEPGDTQWTVVGQRGKNYITLPGPLTHPWDTPTREGEGVGWSWVSFLVEVTRWALGFFWGGAGVEVHLRVLPPPPPAVTCSQFPCHPAVTFHLLATEQKHSAGTLQKGGGSDCQCFD